jgi:hypothetical protein
MMTPAGRTTTYTCLVGHPIAADQLETLTELRVLDQGATVRQCREHGAPIALTTVPNGPKPGSLQADHPA